MGKVFIIKLPYTMRLLVKSKSLDYEYLRILAALGKLDNILSKQEKDALIEGVTKVYFQH